MSFRADYSGSINWDRRRTPVLVTYRAAREGDSVAEVVIVEVVPPGFKPKRQ